MTTNIRRVAILTLALGAGFSLLMSTGCATKKYVRSQVQPVVNHTNQLDSATAKNQRDIQNVDQRAQQGIDQANGAADKAQHQAQLAGQQAEMAGQKADSAQQGVNELNGVVANIGNYKQVAAVTVNFGFAKSTLTPAEQQKLDSFASQIGNTKSYILALTGGTDSTGSAKYNFRLSQERAHAVERYLVAHYQIPPYKFYVIGMGKEDAVASNHTRTGRAQNRRVTIQLMTDRTSSQMASTKSGGSSQMK